MTRKREKSLSLFPPPRCARPIALAGHSEPPPLESSTAHRSQLWLALHLARLPLEVFSSHQDGALVVVEGQGSQRRVLIASPGARALGIRKHQGLNAAFALAPELAVLERDPEQEQRTLERLAAWMGRFSPMVSLEPPQGLLVEVRGSLRLFGGLDSLEAQIHARLEKLGYTIRTGVAPTPLAALWLARAGRPEAVLEPHRLPARLAPLPLTCTGVEERVLEALAGMGVHRVGECLRLPRDGLVRRFGAEYLALLDRALGRQPDPRQAFKFPERFQTSADLVVEAKQLAPLWPGIERLLGEMEGFLRSRQLGVDRLHLGLRHADGSVTPVELELVQPTSRIPHVMGLLEERLARFSLSAPVTALELSAAGLRPLGHQSGCLFGQPVPGQRFSGELLERLRVRLGREAVYSLRLVPEHRPEAAWRKVEPGVVGQGAPNDARPAWMLEQPVPLRGAGNRPRYGGELRLEEGPERIETGWWDGRSVARDYYVASNPRGMRLWIYRERRGRRGWFLHGVFG